LEKKIADLIAKEFEPAGAEQNLFKRLTSLEVVLLVTKLEEMFKVSIEPIEVDDRNFASVASLTKFIATKITA